MTDQSSTTGTSALSSGFTAAGALATGFGKFTTLKARAKTFGANSAIALQNAEQARLLLPLQLSALDKEIESIKSAFDIEKSQIEQSRDRAKFDAAASLEKVGIQATIQGIVADTATSRFALTSGVATAQDRLTREFADAGFELTEDLSLRRLALTTGGIEERAELENAALDVTLNFIVQQSQEKMRQIEVKRRKLTGQARAAAGAGNVRVGSGSVTAQKEEIATEAGFEAQQTALERDTEIAGRVLQREVGKSRERQEIGQAELTSEGDIARADLSRDQTVSQSALRRDADIAAAEITQRDALANVRAQMEALDLEQRQIKQGLDAAMFDAAQSLNTLERNKQIDLERAGLNKKMASAQAVAAIANSEQRAAAERSAQDAAETAAKVNLAFGALSAGASAVKVADFLTGRKLGESVKGFLGLDATSPFSAGSKFASAVPGTGAVAGTLPGNLMAGGLSGAPPAAFAVAPLAIFAGFAAVAFGLQAMGKKKRAKAEARAFSVLNSYLADGTSMERIIQVYAGDSRPPGSQARVPTGKGVHRTDDGRRPVAAQPLGPDENGVMQYRVTFGEFEAPVGSAGARHSEVMFLNTKGDLNNPSIAVFTTDSDLGIKEDLRSNVMIMNSALSFAAQIERIAPASRERAVQVFSIMLMKAGIPFPSGASLMQGFLQQAQAAKETGQRISAAAERRRGLNDAGSGPPGT
jgi:hypothetical protein